jgi:hypothetical protein
VVSWSLLSRPQCLPDGTEPRRCWEPLPLTHAPAPDSLQENVATGAADGFARMARRPALVLLHLGPGLANGLANLHNARRAHSPVVVLVGDMASWHDGADPPLHSDIQAIAATVSSSVVTLRPLQEPSPAPPTAAISPQTTQAATRLVFVRQTTGCFTSIQDDRSMLPLHDTGSALTAARQGWRPAGSSPWCCPRTLVGAPRSSRPLLRRHRRWCRRREWRHRGPEV